MDIWKQQSFDAIIIGSGPGGATVANELSKCGKRSLILERGKASTIKGTIFQSASMALIPGQSLHFTNQFHTLVRGITVGGREFPMAAGYQYKGEGYILTDLVWPGWIYSIFTAQVLRFDRLAAHPDVNLTRKTPGKAFD